jgi:hypothetical protein
MIIKWNNFISEDINNSDNYLDAKMQEIKDLIESVSNGEILIYEWENKNDHELFINFTKDKLSIRYEFDIDDMKVTKIAGETIDFVEDVDSLDSGLSIIEKDIYSILGISESYKLKLKSFTSFNESKYEEKISIIIEAGEGSTFIKSKFYDLEINRKLMMVLNDKFNLNFGSNIKYKHKIDGSIVSEVSDFLVSLGLNITEYKTTDRIKLTFDGRLTLKDIRKAK